MRRVALMILAAVPLLVATPSAARSKAGCLQKQLATAVQGSKMMVRCYGQAQRSGEAIDNSCLERAARRMRVTYSRMVAVGCPPVDDPEQIVSETIGFMDRVVVLLSKPETSDQPGSEATPEATPDATAPTPAAR